MKDAKKTAIEVHAEIVVKLTREDVEDLVCAALEGGVGYWLCLDNTSDVFENAPEDEPTAITAASILLGGRKLEFFDQEDDDRPLEMSLDDLAQGIRMWIEQGFDQYGAVHKGKLDLSKIDGPAADEIFQLALLGEVIYG